MHGYDSITASHKHTEHSGVLLRVAYGCKRPGLNAWSSLGMFVIFCYVGFI